MSHIQYTSDDDAKHGKRKGSVYQSGTQLRAQHRRVNPRQNRTPLQQNNRSIVEFVSRMWKDLSPAEQATWTPCPGETLTGYQLYMSINIIGMEAGEAFQREHECPYVHLYEQPFYEAFYE